MGEICIPLPKFKGGQKADITVKLPDNSYNYRVECFSIEHGNEAIGKSHNEKIYHTLKHKIEQYDSKWELLQVFAPEGDDNLIKILYRQR